ncbi:UNVERIFIED_CONTAM: hypothetical protein PYX00_010527 [Menopon gallinae]|uniref:non-specific serine/threonine protein kinase n=1 Tax=Menopon gallinae TaxID=328185 RepID=A0AAW2HG28_9NEOP
MADRQEPVSLRNKRLFKTVISRSGPMKRSTGMKMTQDALLDAFVLLFDQCNKDTLKKDPPMTKFINKYRSLVTEIKSLRVNVNDFELGSLIGRGHFGEVRVVKEKQTSDIYAMKILKKTETMVSENASLFEEERDVMCINISPWITSLQYAFQDKENLYFVMEYHPGGDLLSLMDRHNGVLSVEMARFYLAETALAVRALHKMGYVHRDIKPDNILLDRCGHVKLADFGSAARLTSSGVVNQTMPVGTPEYVAPEILLSLNNNVEDKKKCYYGTECDYWSLGILAYEMVFGRTPFSGAELKVIYHNIMNVKKINYPMSSKITEDIKDLINKLLEDASIRLDHEGLTKHRFFNGINWHQIRNEVPPFIPTILSEDDTSNFIEFERKKCTPNVVWRDSRKEFSGKDLPFIGFSFNKDSEESILDDGAEDRKSASLQSVITKMRQENQNLISKLCGKGSSNAQDIERLERELEEKSRVNSILEADRNRLAGELAKSQAECSKLLERLESERRDRREMEKSALIVVREARSRLEQEMGTLIQQFVSRIEELNDKLTMAYTVNNELISRCDRLNFEIVTGQAEIDRLRQADIMSRNYIESAQTTNFMNVKGLEVRVEGLANETNSQLDMLRRKLNDEVNAKTDALAKLQEMEAIFSAKESQLRLELKEFEDKIQKLETKNNTQRSEIKSLQLKLQEGPDIVLQQKLEAEMNECAKLRSRIAEMEAELTNTTNSFIDHESAIAQREQSVNALEEELRQVSEEKIDLQMKLQKTKEFEEENRQKLSSLEIVVDRLEEGVIKLEAENTKLKQQLGAYTQPITSEAETRYQERITLLEDQIDKLENQVQNLRETAVLDKAALKNTRSELWKTEKQLSDAKIDIRIARRETKTAEEMIATLNDDLKKKREKFNEMMSKTEEEVAAERKKCENLSAEIHRLKCELAEREAEISTLNNRLEEFDDLKSTYDNLKKEYSELLQECEVLKKQVECLNEEKEKYVKSEETRVQLEAEIDSLKTTICNLELNIMYLKETTSAMNTQLDQFEYCVALNEQTIEQYTEQKELAEKEADSLRYELVACRQSLNEEKSIRLKAEQRVQSLESELHNAEVNLTTLEERIEAKEDLTTKMTSQITELQQKIADAEEKATAFEAECQWLKQEVATHLTNLSTLRETNYQLNLHLEEERQLSIVLKDRVTELENSLTQLEAYNKEREVRDEAIKNQQNKLIYFLQSKIDGKKKKTLSNVLFGARSKENCPPSAGSSNKSEFVNGKTPNSPVSTPSKGKVLYQIVKSPASQFQRHASLPRMHHNIPHRFKNHLVIRSGKCHGCHSGINRGSQASICGHCGIQAHPKCSVTVPKTCGLPDGFAKHYAKSLTVDFKTNKGGGDANPMTDVVHSGWVKIPSSDGTMWEKKFARLDKNCLYMYDVEPQDDHTSPTQEWKLCSKTNHIIIGEVTDTKDLPPTAKSDIPYIIKIAIVTKDSCWPKETYYLMVPITSEKPAWLSALNEVCLPNNTLAQRPEYNGSKLCSWRECHLRSACHINDRLLILGANEGLFSLRMNAEGAEPTKIDGVVKVRQLSVADQIGLVLMIANDDEQLLETDYRCLVSNAETLSYANPTVKTNPISLGSAVESCLLFSVSGKIDGTYYLTAATPTRLIILKWNVKDSEFVVSRVLETLHPCNCVLYTEGHVIVGCDKFFRISLSDYTAQEFLDPSIASLAFWRIGSFPIEIFDISSNEILLCYNEFGVFVNRAGEKVQSDLKWNKAPCQFAFQKPYLYVVHKTSVEVILLSRPGSEQNARAAPCEDTISTTSTATIQDSIYVNFENPRYLGPGKSPGSIIISDMTANSTELILLEGKNVYKNDFGSCISLSSMVDENPNVFLFCSDIPV